MRALDPVGGCYAHIQQLQSHLEYLSVELHSTLQQLAILSGSSSSSSSSSQHLQRQVLLNPHNYHHSVFNNNNNNDVNAMILHHSGSSLHAPPAAHSHNHYVDEQQELPNDVDPNSEDIHLMNHEGLQEELLNLADSIPMSPLIILEDKKEDQHVPIDHHHQNDGSPILGLINDVNSDATRTVHSDQE